MLNFKSGRALTRAGFAFLLLITLQPRASTAFEFFQPVQPPRPVQVMQHRGQAMQAPENTAPALRRCIEDFFEWAEVDVRLTKDGHHVLFHDGNLEGKSNGAGPVSGIMLSEFLQLDGGSWFAKRYAGEKLLTLDAALQLAKGKLNLYLDCKQVNPELLVEQILNAGMEAQVIVFDRIETLNKVRAASNGRVAIMPKWHPGMGLEPWIKEVRLDAVEIDADELTREICRVFHAAGIKVQVKVLGDDWDKPEVWQKVIDAGVDWLQTDLAEDIIATQAWKRIGKRPVQISLHRGANRFAPENTLPAFEKSIRLGMDFVEFDVRTTMDGRHYLLHDGKLERTTTGHGMIAAADSATIATLDAGAWYGRPFAGLKLPTLDEFLSAVEGKIDLYFDAKAISPEALSEAVERHHMAERTIVYQSPDYLATLKAINPKIRALPPLDDPAEIDLYAEGLKPYACDVAHKILSKELIDRCHAKGIKVFCDFMGRPENTKDYLQAIEWGIDLIQTDQPMRLVRAIELHHQGNSTQ